MSEDNVEVRAKEIGWVPQEQYKGDPERWVDASTFVKNSETVLPIIRSQYQKSLGELTNVRTELAAEKAARANLESSVDDLKKFHQEFTGQRVKEARDKLIRDIAEARKAEDPEAEIRLTTQLEDLRETTAAAKAEEKKVVTTTVQRTEAQPDPVVTAWVAENPWYLNDQGKQDIAVGIGLRLAQQGMKGRPLMDAIKVQMEAQGHLDTNVRTQHVDRTLGSRATGNNGGGNSSSYESLPADAKAQCDKDGAKFVGSKLYPDINSWRKYFVDLYNA